MSRCKGCGQPLVLLRTKQNCVRCGTRAGLVRSMGAKTAWTRRGANRMAWQNTSTAPILSWTDAEIHACEWMRNNGYKDAKRTPAGADGGVDVTATKAIAQVKFHARPVGIGEIQRMSGIAAATGKQALYFSNAGYTAKALAWARSHQIQTYLLTPVRRVR